MPDRSSLATQRQVDYIISLHNQVHGTNASYLSQCHALPLAQRERKGGMTKAEASAHIDQLLAELKKKGGNDG